MPVAILWLLGIGTAAAGAGYFVKSSGEAVNDTGNSALKFALAAGIAFIVAKKFKVL